MQKTASIVVLILGVASGVVSLFIKSSQIFYFSTSFFIIFSIIAIIFSCYHIRNDSREKQRIIMGITAYFGIISLSMVSSLILVITGYAERYPGVFINIYSYSLALSGIPLIYVLSKLILRDIKRIHRKQLAMVVFLTMLTLLLNVPFLTTLVDAIRRSTYGKETIVIISVFIFVDIILLFLSFLLAVLYLDLEYGYYGLFLVGSSLLSILADLSGSFLFFQERPNIPFIHLWTLFQILQMTALLTGTLLLKQKSFVLRNVNSIEKERKYYKKHFEDLQIMSKQLFFLTNIIHQELNNDLLVIQSALKTYKEQQSEKYLKLLETRIDKVYKRIIGRENAFREYDNLSLEKIDLCEVLKELMLVEPRLKVELEGREVLIKANRLIYSVFHSILSMRKLWGKENEELLVKIEEDEKKKTTSMKMIEKGANYRIEQLFPMSITEETPYADEKQNLFVSELIIDTWGGSFGIEENEFNGITFCINFQQ